MGALTIRVDGLSKQYRIGAARLRHVEAHVVSRRVGDAEHIAGRQHDIVGERALRDSGRIETVGKLNPQEHAALGFAPRCEAQCFEAHDRLAHGLGQAAVQAVEMLAVTAVTQDLEDKLGGKGIVAERGGELQIDEAVDPVGARRDEA